MGLRQAQGTKPSQLAPTVPGQQDEQSFQDSTQVKSPVRKPASEADTSNQEDVAQEELLMQDQSAANASLDTQVQGMASAQETDPLDQPLSVDPLDQPLVSEQPQDNEDYITKYDNMNDFESSFLGYKFRKNKNGTIEFNGGGKGSPWKDISKMPDDSKMLLKVATAGWLDAPEILASIGTSAVAGAATAGVGAIPTLLAEMAAGAIGGYYGGSIAQDRFRKKLTKNPDDAKTLYFLSKVFGEESQPTSPSTASAFGAGAALLPSAAKGAKNFYDESMGVFKTKLAELEPYAAKAIDSVSAFAKELGVNLDAKSVVRLVDPNIETQIGKAESNLLSESAQTKMLNSTNAQKLKLVGAMQAMEKKFAPNFSELAGKEGSLTSRTAAEIAQDPFSTQVVQPKATLNVMDVVQENMQRDLKDNYVRAKTLAGDLRFDESQLKSGIYDALFEEFPELAVHAKNGRVDTTALLNAFKESVPGQGASDLGKLIGMIENKTSVPVGAIEQTSGDKFVDTLFDAIPETRFQNGVIQQEISSFRRSPVKGMPKQGQTIPITAKNAGEYEKYPTPAGNYYGRKDQPEMDFYLGGPEKPIGATEVNPTTEVQQSLMPNDMSSRALQEGPSAAQNLGPKAGGPRGRGLRFDEFASINQFAQDIAQKFEASGDTRLGGIANRLAKVTRQSEDDAIFKLAAVRGDEELAGKVLSDKAKYTNAIDDIKAFRKYIKDEPQMVGQILKLHPEETKRFLSYLNPAQTEELKGMILNQSYKDAVYDTAEAGVHVKINPDKIAKGLLKNKQTRQNLEILYGKDGLKQLDAISNLATIMNSKGASNANIESMVNSVMRHVYRVPGIAQGDEFLASLFYGRPDVQQLLNTELKNAKMLLRKPEGGVIGKLGKAASVYNKATGLPGKIAATSMARSLPTAIKSVPSRKKEELTLEDLQK